MAFSALIDKMNQGRRSVDIYVLNGLSFFQKQSHAKSSWLAYFDWYVLEMGKILTMTIDSIYRIYSDRSAKKLFSKMNVINGDREIFF
jgi:hypothetical protein